MAQERLKEWLQMMQGVNENVSKAGDDLVAMRKQNMRNQLLSDPEFGSKLGLKPEQGQLLQQIGKADPEMFTAALGKVVEQKMIPDVNKQPLNSKNVSAVLGLPEDHPQVQAIVSSPPTTQTKMLSDVMTANQQKASNDFKNQSESRQEDKQKEAVYKSEYGDPYKKFTNGLNADLDKRQDFLDKASHMKSLLDQLNTVSDATSQQYLMRQIAGEKGRIAIQELPRYLPNTAVGDLTKLTNFLGSTDVSTMSTDARKDMQDVYTRAIQDAKNDIPKSIANKLSNFHDTYSDYTADPITGALEPKLAGLVKGYGKRFGVSYDPATRTYSADVSAKLTGDAAAKHQEAVGLIAKMPDGDMKNYAQQTLNAHAASGGISDEFMGQLRQASAGQFPGQAAPQQPGLAPQPQPGAQ